MAVCAQETGEGAVTGLVSASLVQRGSQPMQTNPLDWPRRYALRFATSLCILCCMAPAAAQPTVETRLPKVDREMEDVRLVGEVLIDGQLHNQYRTFREARVDSDRDGVPDFDDRCPESMPPVNACGCPVAEQSCCNDRDGDGVSDCADLCPSTLVGLRVDATGCVAGTGQRVTLDLKFAVGRAELLPGYGWQLRQVADALAAQPRLFVTLEGHADARGSYRYNQQLSEQRAEAAAAYIRSDPRIAPGRVRAVGFGERKPLVQRDDVEAWWANRRVVARFELRDGAD